MDMFSILSLASVLALFVYFGCALLRASERHLPAYRRARGEGRWLRPASWGCFALAAICLIWLLVLICPSAWQGIVEWWSGRLLWLMHTIPTCPGCNRPQG